MFLNFERTVGWRIGFVHDWSTTLVFLLRLFCSSDELSELPFFIVSNYTHLNAT